MSIPKWEMDNLTQTEFFGKWEKDDTCVGLYGQKVPINFVERLLIESEKHRDRREAAKLVQTFDDKLVSETNNPAQLLLNMRRRKKRRTGRVWGEELPPGTPHFPEATNVPRNNYTPEEVAIICQKKVDRDTDYDVKLDIHLV